MTAIGTCCRALRRTSAIPARRRTMSDDLFEKGLKVRREVLGAEIATDAAIAACVAA